MKPLKNVFPLLVPLQFQKREEAKDLTAELLELSNQCGDFSFREAETENTVELLGVHESQLDGLISGLKNKGYSFKVGAPQIVYLEKITRAATTTYTHKRLFGSTAQFAHVVLEVVPSEGEQSVIFENHLNAMMLPEQFVAGVKKGVQTVTCAGSLLGMPVVGASIILVDAAHHETDSSALAFEIAARAAAREILEQVSVLLEPVMLLKVRSSVDVLQQIIKEVHARRGKLTATDTPSDRLLLSFEIPLANVFGLSSVLTKSGVSEFDLEFSHYAPVSGPDDPDQFPPAVGMRA